MDPNKGKPFPASTVFLGVLMSYLPVTLQAMTLATCRGYWSLFKQVVTREDRMKMLVIAYVDTTCIELGTLANGERIFYCDNFLLDQVFCNYVDRFKWMVINHFPYRQVLKMTIKFEVHDVYLSEEVAALDEEEADVDNGVGGYIDRVRPLTWSFKKGMQSPRKKQRPPRLSTKLSQLQMLLHMSFKTEDVKLHITRFAHRVDPAVIWPEFSESHPEFISEPIISYE